MREFSVSTNSVNRSFILGDKIAKIYLSQNLKTVYSTVIIVEEFAFDDDCLLTVVVTVRFCRRIYSFKVVREIITVLCATMKLLVMLFLIKLHTRIRIFQILSCEIHSIFFCAQFYQREIYLTYESLGKLIITDSRSVLRLEGSWYRGTCHSDLVLSSYFSEFGNLIEESHHFKLSVTIHKYLHHDKIIYSSTDQPSLTNLRISRYSATVLRSEMKTCRQTLETSLQVYLIN